MLIPVLVLVAAIVGMAIIPLRYVPRLRRSPEEASRDNTSIAREPIVAYLDRLDHWYRYSLRESSLRLLDRFLKLVEYSMGRIAGETKKARLLLQERFKVIPRESLYWKSIHTWKKTNGNGNGKETAHSEDHDIAHHED